MSIAFGELAGEWPGKERRPLKSIKIEIKNSWNGSRTAKSAAQNSKVKKLANRSYTPEIASFQIGLFRDLDSTRFGFLSAGIASGL